MIQVKQSRHESIKKRKQKPPLGVLWQSLENQLILFDED
jgi:hypothetical protein